MMEVAITALKGALKDEFDEDGNPIENSNVDDKNVEKTII